MMARPDRPKAGPQPVSTRVSEEATVIRCREGKALNRIFSPFRHLAKIANPPVKGMWEGEIDIHGKGRAAREPRAQPVGACPIK
jgi:hypothetical protein